MRNTKRSESKNKKGREHYLFIRYLPNIGEQEET